MHEHVTLPQYRFRRVCGLNIHFMGPFTGRYNSSTNSCQTIHFIEATHVEVTFISYLYLVDR